MFSVTTMCLTVVVAIFCKFNVATADSAGPLPSTTPITAGTDGALQGGLSLSPASYPAIYRNDSVKDNYFGVDVYDPYRWLESDSASAIDAFVNDQNDVLNSCLGTTNQLLEELNFFGLWYDVSAATPSCPDVTAANASAPIYQGSDLNFYIDNSNGKSKLVFNCSKIDFKGTYAVYDWTKNADQSYLTISFSNNASDWLRIRIVRVDQNHTGHVLEEALDNTKGQSPLWSLDNKGFFYSRYPFQDSSRFSNRGMNNSLVKYPQLYYHVVGTNQSQDIRLLAFPGHPTWEATVAYTDDQEYLVITVSRNEVYNKLWLIKYSDLPLSLDAGGLDFSSFDRQQRNRTSRNPLPLMKLIDDFRASYTLLYSDGEIFTFASTYNSTATRLLRTNVTQMLSPDKWQVLATVDGLQTALSLTGDTFVASYLLNMLPVLKIHNKTDGSLLRQLPDPVFDTVGGTIASLCPGKGDTDFFYIYSSMTNPGSVYRYDTAHISDPPFLHRKPRIPGGYQTDSIQTSLYWVPSKDGTVQIPLLLTRKKDMPLDGLAPTILHGYGGQDVIESQSYLPSVIAWILGYNGVYAFAAVRGGGELGLDWWNNGHGMTKQHTFDDFVSCAQYLIQMKITSPSKLGIQGSSNGGLLMGAVLNQNPGLWSAVVSEAGVYDMLRLPRYGEGTYFIREYGDAQRNKTQFQNLLSYSPLHNVRVPNGTHQYPAVLLTVGDHDDRISPFHTYKFLSTLQHTLAGYKGSAQTNPILLLVQPHVGHAEAGKEVVMAFTARALNAQWAHPYSPISSWYTGPRSSNSGGAARLGCGAWVGIGIACAVALATAIGAGFFIHKNKNRKDAKAVSTADSHMDAKL